MDSPLLCGGFFCLSGYTVVRLYLTSFFSLRPIDEPHTTDVPFLRLLPVLIAMYLTGSGGSAGMTCGVNATAKSFPDASRATATGSVLAGFGLSAFLFSTLGHVFFPGDAAGLLGLLSFGTSIPMLLGSWLIRPVPPRDEKGYQALHQSSLESGEEQGEYAQVRRRPDIPEIIITGETRASVDMYRVRSNASVELGSSHSRGSTHQHRPLHDLGETGDDAEAEEEDEYEREMALAKAMAHGRDEDENRSYHPMELACHPPFLALALVLGLLCGTGLMYINNVGTVVLALGREGRVEYDAEQVGGWQAQMVGLVSIWNCLGRILGGKSHAPFYTPTRVIAAASERVGPIADRLVHGVTWMRAQLGSSS